MKAQSICEDTQEETKEMTDLNLYEESAGFKEAVPSGFRER